MSDAPVLAGVELGGTKSIVLLARGSAIIERQAFPTTTPKVTLGNLAMQLRQWGASHQIAGLGIASFGPIRLDRMAADFGCILNTPKPGWSGANVAHELGSVLDCPFEVDTDVNGAALAEFHWGGGSGCSSVCYITIGTGVGGGLVIDGRPVHGAMHPEIGHLRLRRVPGDSFAGTCPFHGDCIEGLVSGPALAARLGSDPAQVAEDDPRWLPVAADIAELAGAVILAVSAERVLVGGGVGMGRPFLLPLVREILLDRLGSYLPHFNAESAARMISLPTLGETAGPMGAIALALMAMNRSGSQVASRSS